MHQVSKCLCGCHLSLSTSTTC